MRRVWRLIGSVGVLLVILGCLGGVSSARKPKPPKFKHINVSNVSTAGATVTAEVLTRGEETHWEISFAKWECGRHGCERPTNEVVAEGTIPAGTLSAQIEGVWVHTLEPFPRHERGYYGYEIYATANGGQEQHEGVVRLPKR